jgi:hypothetical protein
MKVPKEAAGFAAAIAAGLGAGAVGAVPDPDMIAKLGPMLGAFVLWFEWRVRPLLVQLVETNTKQEQQQQEQTKATRELAKKGRHITPILILLACIGVAIGGGVARADTYRVPARVITGTVDPQTSGVAAARGTVYTNRSTGHIYVKTGAANTAWAYVASGASASEPSCGTAADGDGTIASGTTTLTFDRYYDNLVLQSGAILDTGGYRVFVRGNLTMASGTVIRRNGNSGTNGGAAGSTVAAGAASAAGTLAATLAGGNGGSFGTGGTGAASAQAPLGWSNGTNAGGTAGTTGVAGGNATALAGNIIGQGGGGGGGGWGDGSTAGAGGSSGTVTRASNDLGLSLREMRSASTGRGLTNVIGTFGSGGGGGGGSSNGNTPGVGGNGGGGGGGGGHVFVAVCGTVSASGASVQANGGNGGNGGNGASGNGAGGGGGGGGGGGVVVFALRPGQTAPTLSVTGGAGGTGGTKLGTGSNGGSGAAGAPGIAVTLRL